MRTCRCAAASSAGRTCATTSRRTPKGLAAEKEFGEHDLALCERVFWAWEVFQHTHDRRELKRTIRSLQRQSQADHPLLRHQARPQQALPQDSQKPPESLARPVDLRLTRRGRANQQPRRARATQRRHLPQALPRQPIQGWQAPHRPAALGAYHLPATAPLTIRLPEQRHRHPHPQRPHTATHLSRPTERLHL
jgi:hypothetical protein